MEPVSTVITFASILQDILTFITAIAQHPLTTSLSVGGISLAATVAWFFISGKFTAWRQQMAQNTTQNNEDNFVNNQTPQNQQDNNEDNKGRTNLQ